jgi:hypothetical protein
MRSPLLNATVLTMLTAAMVSAAGTGCVPSPLSAKYPKASAAFDVVDRYPLIQEALLDDGFFGKLDDPSFYSAVRARLAQAHYRRIGPVAAVRARIMPATPANTAEIYLDYQTQFNEFMALPDGDRFDGTCVFVGGGRDSMRRRTLYGATEDPSARAQYDALFAKRQAMASRDRGSMDPQFAALITKAGPKMPLPQVRSEVQGILQTLVKAFEPYGAKVLDDPLGHYGVKVTDHLYLTLRDFAGQTDEEGGAGLRYRHDPFFWLVLSGGPKELPHGYLPAFPGAEGMGAMTTGGRGGKVIYVTTLAADGPGSLVEALKTPGPRIILFAVSGQIRIPRDVWITQGDFTMIGYTAPGEGVEVCGRLCMAASNVILRGMRFRLRPPLRADAMDTRGDLHHIVFDHCSFAYGSDELIRFIGNGATFWDYTIQYCLLGPGLGGLGSHPYGPEIGGIGSIHHNILYDTLSRSPEVDCDLIDWRNNILFNCRSGHSRRSHSRFNLVDNYIIDNVQIPYRYSFGATDNVWAAGNLREAGGSVTPFEVHHSDYLKGPYRVMSVETDPPTALEAKLVPIAGAFLPVRDKTDEYFLAGLKSRIGMLPYWHDPSEDWAPYDKKANKEAKIYESWKDVNFPPPAPGATAAADTDGDGMPDAWETAHGFNPTDPTDGPADSDGDGYTNVEEYLYRTDPHQAVDYRDPANNVHTLHPEGN